MCVSGAFQRPTAPARILKNRGTTHGASGHSRMCRDAGASTKIQQRAHIAPTLFPHCAHIAHRIICMAWRVQTRGSQPSLARGPPLRPLYYFLWTPQFNNMLLKLLNVYPLEVPWTPWGLGRPWLGIPGLDKHTLNYKAHSQSMFIMNSFMLYSVLFRMGIKRKHVTISFRSAGFLLYRNTERVTLSGTYVI